MVNMDVLIELMSSPMDLSSKRGCHLKFYGTLFIPKDCVSDALALLKLTLDLKPLSFSRSGLIQLTDHVVFSLSNDFLYRPVCPRANLFSRTPLLFEKCQ